MHYLQMEFEAHDRQEELLREARERRLAHDLKPSTHDDGVLKRLLLRRLAGLLRREPGYEALSAVLEEDGEVIPCPSEHTKTAGTS
jgi:hypothetical protein